MCGGAALSNFCLTVNGSGTLPDTLTYVRESEGKPNRFDTLELDRWGSCFFQSSGKKRVLAYSRDSLVYKSDWILLPALNCCGDTKDTTIDLPL